VLIRGENLAITVNCGATDADKRRCYYSDIQFIRVHLRESAVPLVMQFHSCGQRWW